MAACADLMRTLAGVRPAALSSLADLTAGVAWLDLAEPLVAERVAAAAACFPPRRPLALPLAEGISPAFQREVADVHRELFAEHRALYGENVRTKVERCLRVTDAEYEGAVAARERYRERCLEAVAGIDVVVAPTLAFVAPDAGIPELELREAMIRLTFPFNALGWPALALPCGPAERGLPASVSLVARPGQDALVLAAGLTLERALASS